MEIVTAKHRWLSDIEEGRYERSTLLLVAMPGAPSSFLLLVAMHLVTSSVLVPSSKALVTRSDALVSTSFLLLVASCS